MTNRMYSILFMGFCAGVAPGQITQTKLTASDGEGDDRFGWSVSVSGHFALIGAWGDDDNGNEAGSAYIFHYDDFHWVQEMKLAPIDPSADDLFGYSVSLSNDRSVVGALFGNSDASQAGAAYIFRYDGLDWVQEDKLTPAVGATFDYFGNSVSLSGDFVLIGAEGDGEHGISAGAAYVFYNDGSQWVQQAKLTASDGSEFDYFGLSVSVSGNYALIGAPGDADHGFYTGAAYIFHYDGANWEQEAKLTANDGRTYDYFGSSVSISGENVLIGANADDDNGLESGSVYIFQYNGSNWIQQAKLIANDGTPYDYFGYSVSVSGDHALIGANGDSDLGFGKGSAYIFHYNGSIWVQESKIVASDGMASDSYGFSVSMSEDYALVGAVFDDVNGTDAGSAYVHTGFSEAPSLTVVVTLDPPSGSGLFNYITDFTNNTDSSLTVDIWTEMSGPGGRSKVGRISEEKTLDGGRSYSESLTASLDDGAPLGDYVFVVNVGEYPDVVTASASAPYAKTSFDKGDELLTGEAPAKTKLLDNHPNPFNPSTTIRYALSEDTHVTLRVYNMLGQLVATLVDELQTTGYKSVVWDGRSNSGANAASGMYVYRMSVVPHGGDGTAGVFTAAHRMLLLK